MSWGCLDLADLGNLLVDVVPSRTNKPIYSANVHVELEQTIVIPVIKEGRLVTNAYYPLFQNGASHLYVSVTNGMDAGPNSNDHYFNSVIMSYDTAVDIRGSQYATAWTDEEIKAFREAGIYTRAERPVLSRKHASWGAWA